MFIRYKGKKVLIYIYVFFICFFYSFFYRIGINVNINRTLFIIMQLLMNIYYLKFRRNNILSFFIIAYLYYLVFSIFLVFMRNNDTTNLLYQIFDAILPINYYFIAIEFSDDDLNSLKDAFFCLFIFMITIQLLYNMNFPFPVKIYRGLTLLMRNNVSFFHSDIAWGYLSQLLFAFTLFSLSSESRKHEYIMLFVFCFVSILTFQRSSYLGILMACLAYAFSWLIKEPSYFFKIIKYLVLVILLLLMIFMVLQYFNVYKIDIKKFFVAEIHHFDIMDVFEKRSNQSILPFDNLREALLGKGYGFYSQYNNNAKIIIADNNLPKMFSELGLIGFSLFMAPFFIFIIISFFNNNYFGLYFILHALIATHFNRIIWSIPSGIFFYMFLAIALNNIKVLHNVKLNNEKN